MSSAPGPRFLRDAEAMNVSATLEHWSLVPREVERRLRPKVMTVGDGLLTMARGSEALRMNRVIGFGHRGEAREEMVDRMVAIFREARVPRFSVLMSPGPQSASVTAWLGARGFQPRGGLMMLARDARLPAPDLETRVRVRRASRTSAPLIVSIQQRCFGFPPSRRAWSLAAARVPTYDRYLAFVGRTAVAVAAMRIEGKLAWLGGAGTLTRWRRRGAQSALIVARMREAARRGCRWVWVETMAPAAGRPGGSRRNLIRLGFKDVGAKPMFVWQAR